MRIISDCVDRPHARRSSFPGREGGAELRQMWLRPEKHGRKSNLYVVIFNRSRASLPDGDDHADRHELLQHPFFDGYVENV